MEHDSLKKYLKGRKLLCLSLKPARHFHETWGLNYNADNCPTTSKEREIQEDEKIEEGPQSQSLDLIMSNYVIMQKILGNFNTWQELKLLSMVCKVWADAAKSITKNCLKAKEFCLFTRTIVKFSFEMEEDLRVEPSLILTFANAKSLRSTYPCHLYPNSPCDISCKEKHKMMDYIYAKLCYPSKVLLGVYCSKIVYVPPAITESPMHRKMLSEIIVHKDFAFISGVCLPRIPGVNVHEMSNPKSTDADFSFIPKIMDLMKKEVIKCILIFAGTHFPELENYLQGIILFIKENQDEGNPLAVGGCRVKCSFNDDFNICSARDGKKMTFLIFSVDKDSETPVDFETHSAVFKEGGDVELKMRQLAKMPRREFSVGIKLSCIGRTGLYEYEQEVFCKYFPSTSLVGCYGHQEIGADCYPSLNAEELEPAEKRARGRFDSTESVTDPEDLFHSYSTVMVILMWGKLLSNQKKSDAKS